MSENKCSPNLRGKSKRFLVNTFKEVDLFGKPVTLLIDGQESITSIPGAIVSIFLIIVLLGYSSYQVNLVYLQDNDVSSTVNYGFFPSSYYVHLNERSIKFAFGVANYDSYEAKDDPEFVEWQVLYKVKTNDSSETKELELKKCTDAEYEDFYPSFIGD